MKFLVTLLLCLTLTSCSVVRTLVDPIAKTPLHLSEPTPLVLKDVKFVVIHKDNAEAVFAELEKSGVDPVVFALTGDDYKALATNITAIKGFLKVQKKIIVLYKDYYEEQK